jgi:hypothetical protein
VGLCSLSGGSGSTGVGSRSSVHAFLTLVRYDPPYQCRNGFTSCLQWWNDDGGFPLGQQLSHWSQRASAGLLPSGGSHCYNDGRIDFCARKQRDRVGETSRRWLEMPNYVENAFELLDEGSGFIEITGNAVCPRP